MGVRACFFSTFGCCRLFMLAVSDKRRRFKSCFQRSTARQDTEEAERTRWIDILALLVKDTPTPLGQMVAVNSRTVQLMIACPFVVSSACSPQLTRRCIQSAWTIGRAISKLACQCNRGALKCTKKAFNFLDQVTGTPSINGSPPHLS